MRILPDPRNAWGWSHVIDRLWGGFWAIVIAWVAVEFIKQG